VPRKSQYFTPQDSPLLFQGPRFAALVRDWLPVLLGNKISVQEPYQSRDGRPFIHWLIYVPHPVAVQPLYLSKDGLWSYGAFDWFYNPFNYHLADTWWWYIAFASGYKGLCALGLVPLALLIFAVVMLRRSSRVIPDKPDLPSTARKPKLQALVVISIAALLTTYALVVGISLAERNRQLNLVFGDKIELQTYDVELSAHAGSVIRLRLYWQSLQSIGVNYSIVAQLVDINGNLVAQTDNWPVDGKRPTSGWNPGDQIADFYHIVLPTGLPEANYRLLVGIYNKATLESLPIKATGQHEAFLGYVKVVP
jgi:hypothetical protein